MENLNYVARIKKEYEVKDTTKVDELKRLDKKVKLAPSINAYAFGSVSALIFGAGMCFAMNVISGGIVLGVILGVIGIALMTVNPIIYNAWMNKNKKKYGKAITDLADELLTK